MALAQRTPKEGTSQRLPPCLDKRLFSDSFRWTERSRVLMVSAMLKELTWPEMQAVMDDQPLPSLPSRMSPVYDALHQKLISLLWQEAEEQGVQLEQLPTRRAIKEAAQRWTCTFLRLADVHDTKPHQPGYLLAANHDALAAIHDLILRGWIDSKGQMSIYRSLFDLQTKAADEFAPLFAATKLKTLDALWSQLTQAFPSLAVVVRRVKKERDAPSVQACARQCLGLDAVDVPDIYKPHADYPALGAATAPLFAAGADFFWQESNYMNTWFIDALTVDPSEMLANDKGIWARGVPQPVTERKIENANIGTLPKVLVYIAVHPKYGAHSFFPFHGAKHGGSAVKKAADKGMYASFQFWHHRLNEAELLHLKNNAYYNMAHADAVDADWLADPDEVFNPLNFTTKPGDEARSIVASEIAAMFDLNLWPTLLSHYVDPTNPAVLEKHCRDMAKRLGLPRDCWPKVHYPFFISLDWDPRHAHMRRLMTTPRLPAEVQEELHADCVQQLLQVPLPARKRPRGLAEAAAWHESVQKYESALNGYYREHGVHFWPHVAWNAGQVRPWHRTLLPRQFAPLVRCTPDINSPAEHMVNSIKLSVRAQLLAHDMHSPELWKGPVYQRFIENAVAQRGALAEGVCHHVMRSVEKLSCILRILAADEGEEVLVQYAFSPGGAQQHIVLGTGGKWIRDTRFT